jgi:hypothetical protein
MTETLEQPADVFTPCPVCREPIRKGARKCIHCTSMLDWRGWLGISETALALLVALVSVLGASAPRVAELFTRDYSDVRLNYRQVNSQYLELTAWNQGNKNGLLSSAKMIARSKDGKELGLIKLEVSSPPLILAGQQAVSGFRIPPA